MRLSAASTSPAASARAAAVIRESMIYILAYRSFVALLDGEIGRRYLKIGLL
jgi:hypothetical protein